MNTNKSSNSIYCIITICTVIVAYFIWDYCTEVSKWRRLYPQYMSERTQKNEIIIDKAVLAIDNYYKFHGYAPTALSDLVSDPIAYKSWLLLTSDSWGRTIGYSVSVSGTTTVVRVWSYGCDGKPGGEGSAADLYREWQPNKADKPNINEP